MNRKKEKESEENKEKKNKNDETGKKQQKEQNRKDKAEKKLDDTKKKRAVISSEASKRVSQDRFKQKRYEAPDCESSARKARRGSKQLPNSSRNSIVRKITK
ncbi:unnamed protein product [Strongylus vulgaris]|uniref:Uncharacterized protein n=1 Tax=Strongylus vulgaris TaxID=40348 RepID=A0A3P7KA87_STRVU|nr:unnamed protein product [Strongylus vulgaris]